MEVVVTTVATLGVFGVGCLVSLMYATDRQRNRCQTASSFNACATCVYY